MADCHTVNIIVLGMMRETMRWGAGLFMCCHAAQKGIVVCSGLGDKEPGTVANR